MLTKRLKVFFAGSAVLSAVHGAAQFSIPTVDPSATPIAPPDTMKKAAIRSEFFNEGAWLAEKRRIRKERNTTELNADLQLSQTQFDNWAPGGDNTFAMRSSIFFRHQYKIEKFALDYKFDARYGFNRIEKKLFKNEDEFKFNLLSTWKMKKYWSYATTTNLRSQFTPGYNSRNDRTKKSDFMSPGFVDVAIGFNYHRDKSPISITLSPVSGNIIVVLNDSLSRLGINGVEKGKHTKGQIGPSAQIDLDMEFAKKICRYRSRFYSFTNIQKPPTVRWENTLEIRPTKYLTTTLYALLYYDKMATTPKPQKLQCTYSLGIGLAYRFKNK